MTAVAPVVSSASSTAAPTVEDVEVLVRRWLAEAETHPVDPAAQRLAGVLKDPNGLAFTVGFVDGVMRPEDLHVAARALAGLAPITPCFLPWHLRAAIRLGLARRHAEEHLELDVVGHPARAGREPGVRDVEEVVPLSLIHISEPTRPY